MDFFCKTKNKLYIGSSINLSTRFNQHVNGLNSNVLLQREGAPAGRARAAINKYNLQEFIFIIFGYCEAPPPGGGPNRLTNRFLENNFI